MNAAERAFDPRRLREYVLEDGWRVWVGKTEIDNDWLSLKLCRPNEFWFHAAGCAGAHAVLLEQPGLDPPAAILRQAAAIAAWHSKARTARRADVHYTMGACVGKRRGAPAGEVTIRRERSLKVVPQVPQDRPEGS
jgi:predicted ribosome quality control (RQC) complex YloA/Tae2 family protein